MACFFAEVASIFPKPAAPIYTARIAFGTPDGIQKPKTPLPMTELMVRAVRLQRRWRGQVVARCAALGRFCHGAFVPQVRLIFLEVILLI